MAEGRRLHLEREFDVRLQTSFDLEDLRHDDPARVSQRNAQPGKEVHRLRRHRGENLNRFRKFIKKTLMV